MLRHPLVAKIQNLYQWLVGIENFAQHPLLLIMRLYWGYQFFLAGKGKLMNLERTAGYFASIDIPLPYLNALMAGSTECFGGLLLVLGLGSRLAAIPLTFTMVVAYLTAHREELSKLFSEPQAFLTAEPFLFLLTSLLVLAFGPGIFSLDTVIKHVLHKAETDSKSHTNTPTAS